jgi:hypothetical protein
MKELSTGCAYKQPDSVGKNVAYVDIFPVKDSLFLGETVALFGKPIGSKLCWNYGLNNRPVAYVSAVIYFENNIMIEAYNPHDLEQNWFDPYMMVQHIKYSADGPPNYTTIPLWEGFNTPAHIQSCDNINMADYFKQQSAKLP